MLKLVKLIVSKHNDGYRLYGPHYRYRITPDHAKLIKQSSWYRGKMFHDMSGNSVPNGDVAHVASGSCWALATNVIKEQEIPASYLHHNGGDYSVGIQVAQGGWKIADFSSNKSVVNWSAFARRGLNEAHPGQPGWPGNTK